MPFPRIWLFYIKKNTNAPFFGSEEVIFTLLSMILLITKGILDCEYVYQKTIQRKYPLVVAYINCIGCIFHSSQIGSAMTTNHSLENLACQPTTIVLIIPKTGNSFISNPGLNPAISGRPSGSGIGSIISFLVRMLIHDNNISGSISR